MNDLSKDRQQNMEQQNSEGDGEIKIIDYLSNDKLKDDKTWQILSSWTQLCYGAATS